jgi:nucleotide-binding universal stress UspA family protein
LKYQSEIHVLYVIEELARHEPWYGDFDTAHIEKIHEWEEKKAMERIDRLCEERLKGCILFHKETAIGDPVDEILKFVERYRIDMIVMTTHGRKSRFSLGSVTEKVLEKSPVPVVTIPA